MRKKHEGLEIIGATTEANKAAIADFRKRSGADYPILRGLSEESKKAYGVKGYPFFVVLNKDGTIAGSDDAAIKSAVGG